MAEADAASQALPGCKKAVAGQKSPRQGKRVAGEGEGETRNSYCPVPTLPPTHLQLVCELGIRAESGFGRDGNEILNWRESDSRWTTCT